MLLNSSEYLNTVESIKQEIRAAQYRASVSVNRELLLLYHTIGNTINAHKTWGSKFIESLSADIKLAFPDASGYSVRNLKYMAKFALAYPDEEFVQQPVAQIPWGHNITLLDKLSDNKERLWYAEKIAENGWSRNVLVHQIESGLYQRQVLAEKVSNFESRLPSPQSELAAQTMKDPYIFDLAGAKERADERDIEEQLVKHVTRYLLEMGSGFAFVARQKHFQIGDSDFYADLILYNIKLHAYVVVELKATPFKPEYAGQLNFYINVVDDKLRGENDNKTIGLLLCKGKDEIVAQYALTGYDQPIGISDYQLSKAVPESLKSALPSIEQVEEELTMLLDNEKNRQK